MKESKGMPKKGYTAEAQRFAAKRKDRGCCSREKNQKVTAPVRDDRDVSPLCLRLGRRRRAVSPLWLISANQRPAKLSVAVYAGSPSSFFTKIV